ncbi:MAG: hypothetical protein KJ737_07320 [Proteobacteria bacterium]|nr:hypothetical protein [Pseudomonadota bacterium]
MPGTVLFVAESDGLKVLFSQDIHGPIHPELLSVSEDYLESLQEIRSLNADILCEGHSILPM